MQSSEDNIGITPNGDIAEDLSRDENPSSSTSGMYKENGNLKLSVKRYDFEETIVLFELVCILLCS
jgi:hypothetical protein